MRKSSHFKSKRSQACSISKEVKEKVFERDGGHCIICHLPGMPDAHYIRRSQGGLGIEQNVVTLCRVCHTKFDDGFYRSEYGDIIRKYLQGLYENWNEEDLYYRKWRY